MEFTGVSNSSTASAHAWRVAADAAMKTVATVLTDAPFGPAADAIQDYRDTLAAVEALLIAQRKKAGHSDRANEGIIKNSGRVSKGEAKRRTRRADAVETNPTLATKLTTGDLSIEKVDLLADASAKTEGAAAIDATLIDEVSNANPEQAKAIVRKFVATRGQWLALVVRDAGCALCEAHHTDCEAHHLVPWNALAQGETNIDELALVCVDCHHRIHDNNQTLLFDTKIREWRLRAAKPDEIPPTGRRPQPVEKAVLAKSSEPSGSRPADSKTSVNTK